MKTNKKALLTVVCALLLVVASVMGTLAYLTAEASVTNTFTVGNVSMTMDETNTDKAAGEGDRDNANSYKVYPGGEYVKDPQLHIGATSDNCWLFIEVTNNIAAIETTEEGKTIAEQIVAAGWEVLEEGVYYKEWTTEDAKDVDTFTMVYISEDITNEDLVDFGSKTVEVKAYAIQLDGFEDDAEGAYAAVKEAYEG